MPHDCLQTDLATVANCGSCGRNCSAGAEPLPGPFVALDGRLQRIDLNPQAVACTAGQCIFECKPGFADCDANRGSEVRGALLLAFSA
jgi:hypothetical protein